MAQNKGIYKCDVCGNIVAVLASSAADLVCCEQDMTLQQENSVDASGEKHVPIIKKTSEGFNVTVGSTEHPMTKEHYIMFIELMADGIEYIKHLKPGDTPIANFNISAESVTIRAYCNIHGLWKNGL